MKTFKGTPIGIERTLLARVIKKAERAWFSWNSAPTVYIAESQHKKLPKATAYIFSDSNTSNADKGKTIIAGVPKNAISELNEGDIVLMTEAGRVSVVYELASKQNVIFATNRCNLHCVMCPQPSKADEEEMLQHNLKLISMMSPDCTSNIAISGGEPTLLGEGFLSLVKACKDHLPKTALIVLTNGTRFKDLEFVRQITQLGHPNLTFAIPLYSDIDTIHDGIVGIPGSFFDTLKGLHNLALFRHFIEIRSVVNAINYKRLPKLAEFIYRNIPFVTHIAIMGLEITGEARKNYETVWVDPFDYTAELVDAVRILNRGALNISIYNHQLCILPQSLWRFSRQSISTWKNSYIDACVDCSVKESCGGFFETSGEYISQHIKPIENIIVN